MRKKKLKIKIKVLRGTEEVFFGRPLELKIKEDSIINKSIELFDDADPCIIHQSYVVKEYTDYLIELFGEKETLNGKDHASELTFLDYEDVEGLSFELVR